MKIIPLLRKEKAIIRQAASGSRSAQRQLYEQHAPTMLAVCRRYVRDLHHAEDVMIEGFATVFRQLGAYRSEGSFEGWVRRIMVRKAIDFLRRRQFLVPEESLPEQPGTDGNPSDFLELQAIREAIGELPEGYRLVFNLYVVEGYRHPEIAALLDISESTSKSQLFKARKMLQEQLKEQQIPRYGTH